MKRKRDSVYSCEYDRISDNRLKRLIPSMGEEIHMQENAARRISLSGMIYRAEICKRYCLFKGGTAFVLFHIRIE